MALRWLCGGFGWLCPAFRDWMLDVRRSMFDVPDREPSRFAAGRNGLGCWTFWRLLALVAAANRDGSRSDPELDAALPRWGAHLDTTAGRCGPKSETRNSKPETNSNAQWSKAQNRQQGSGFGHSLLGAWGLLDRKSTRLNSS